MSNNIFIKNNGNKLNELIVSGDLIFATVMDVWNQSKPFLEKQTEYHFDFSQVDKIDSSALALLLEWLRYAKQKKRAIFFRQIPEQLKSIAKVANIDLGMEM